VIDRARGLRRLASVGPDDRLLRLPLFAGPVVVAVIGLVGRSRPAEVIGAAYVLTVVGVVIYQSARAR
jgi:hypothetical protein